MCKKIFNKEQINKEHQKHSPQSIWLKSDPQCSRSYVAMKYHEQHGGSDFNQIVSSVVNSYNLSG